MNPRVSVVIPVYNREEYIEGTVKSVLTQTFDDFEIIAIDDCSKDGSLDLLKKMAEFDSRIRVFANDENLGVAQTRNKGIDLAKGDYIALLDSDDLWLENKLEDQIEHIQTNKCRLAYCSYGLIDKDGESIGEVFRVPAVIDLKKLLKKNVISCTTVIGERELFVKNKFNENFFHEDLIAWIDMVKECENAYGIDKELAKIRIMKGTRSAKKINAAKQRWLIYRGYLQMGIAESLYFFSFYALNSIMKYKKVMKGF